MIIIRNFARYLFAIQISSIRQWEHRWSIRCSSSRCSKITDFTLELSSRFFIVSYVACYISYLRWLFRRVFVSMITVPLYKLIIFVFMLAKRCVVVEAVISRWVALTLISWGATLITSVQPWSSEANWMKMWVESTLFRVIHQHLFILLNKTEPIEWPVCQCLRQHRGFQRTLRYLAQTAATNVRQYWYCEVSANFEETFDFSRINVHDVFFFLSNVICFIVCIANLLSCFHLAPRTQFLL